MENEVKRSEDFKEISVDAVFGGVTPKGAKIEVIHDLLKPRVGERSNLELEGVEHVVEAELNFDPVEFKQTVKWLNGKLEEYERKFGEIKLKEEEKEKELHGYT